MRLHFSNPSCYLHCFLVFCALLGSPPTRAADNVFISEFMAANERTLADENGDYSDWIEIHNAGTNVVNLGGWFLTDKANQLTQWQFPSTNLLPNAYLIVFASGNNRRTPGAPLHTNFRLSDNGEYLALVRPDGATVASVFNPFPGQASGVSYGVPVVQSTTNLVAPGAPAKFHVPSDNSLASSWTLPGFDDSSWLDKGAGLGFENGSGPFIPQSIASSVSEFSGVQGRSNWFYGYWNKGTDANGVYAASEFIQFPSNYWTGSAWDWPSGDPPFTLLTAQGGRPSASNGRTFPDHAAIRRYVNEHDGPVTISGTITHSNDWVYVTLSGVGPSSGTYGLYIYQTGVGEGYLDDIKLVSGNVPEAGANLLTNGDFEAGIISPWTVSANLTNSAITTAVKHSGNRSLRLVSAAGGTTQTSSIWQGFPVTSGQTYTLSYWYLPSSNSSPLVIRTGNSWIVTQVDGVTGHIFVDGVEVFSQSVLASSVTYSFTVPAKLGSKIDFALDAGDANFDHGDTASFTANLESASPGFTLLADSAADWSVTGTQGEKNWFYGYYNRSADPDKTYQAENFILFPRASGPQSPANFWDEEEWDWFNGNPPFDKIGQYWMNPNGTNSGAEHWVIRRWVSPYTGDITVHWRALKEYPDQNNPGGDGATLHIFHNGVQRDVQTIPGGDVVGKSRTFNITGVQAGDTIDIALDPRDVDGAPHDDTDRTFVHATISGFPSLSTLVSADVDAEMRDVNPSAYLRIPFNVDDPSAFNSLLLRMKYDDGFVAYLNGVEVARANAPLTLEWNSAATAERSDAANNEWQDFNLGAELGLLRPGLNVLAIHGLNSSLADPDFLILPQLTASSETFDLASRRYFKSPTPGEPNGLGDTALGPIVLSASHSPNVPRDSDNLLVTAQVLPSFNAISSVRLVYRVMYSNEVTVPMFDDGLHGDAFAGDGIFGATIPSNVSSPGQMVRYYIYASDSQTNNSRFPAYENPQNSPQYQGTVVVNPGLTNPLPVLQWFVQNPASASAMAGTRCSIFWDGEFFDNVGVSGHGQTTWQLPTSLWPNKSLDFNLNTGYKLQPKPELGRVKAFDLLSPYGDKAYMRLPLAFNTFTDAGVPAHFAFPIRVQQNNAFHSVMWMVEQANDDYLKRNGQNDDGAMYKIYFPLVDPYAGAKKVTRKNEPNADLGALISGLSRTGSDLRAFLFDNLDLPEVINFFATIEVVQNEDCCYYKNYYLYRDTTGTGEWQIFPWDLDLTFGRTFTAWPSPYNGLSGGYFDTNIFYIDRYFTELVALKDFIGAGQPLFDAIYAFPDTRDMFLRRWTSVQEQFLQKSNTHPFAFYYENRIDAFTAQLAPDAALDLAKWGTWPPAAPVVQTQPAAAAVIKTNYLAPRRNWIFNTLAFASGGPYLGTQPANATIIFGDIELSSSSGNPKEEFIQLKNTNRFSVDISGWKLGGGVQHTFKAGTVIPSNGVIYLSPDVNAFRARATGPRGGQGLLVQGNYKGMLSARGEYLELVDQTGRLVQSTFKSGTPSPAQNFLRITEIMYHPASSPPGLPLDPDEFEFIELMNQSPDMTLDLTGVHFSAGIDFSFTGSAVTNLAPGASVVLVKNLTAFVSRYGTNVNVAGQYTGFLDNAGETLRLDDAYGEKILEFSYSNDWQPITDGLGFALEIDNEFFDWQRYDLWGDWNNWRVGEQAGGSPGQTNDIPPLLFPVLVNEVLTRSTPPSVDAIELWNPLPFDVNIGGWFISDDFRNPKKFRIPAGIVIYAYDYLSFDEHWFSRPTNSPTSFSFSSLGDEVYIFSADNEGNLTGYHHGFSFGAAEPGVSFGRHVDSLNREHFVAQQASTFWDRNAGPAVGPVVLNRVMYQPLDYPDGSDNTEDEFIELRNISSLTVPLFDPGTPAVTWRLEGGLSFAFPPFVTLPPDGLLLLVNFDPSSSNQLAAFRAKYDVPAGTPVYGPVVGKLNNSADNIRLFKPSPAVGNVVPYVLVDRLDYTSAAPWPVEAGGAGAALQRRVPFLFGNDPASWVPALPTPGRLPSPGLAPAITAHPASRVAYVLDDISITVAATGSAPLGYQWRRNGSPIPNATNATLALNNLQLASAGNYDVTVFNTMGAVASSNAVLDVRLPVLFTRQPSNTLAIANTPASLSVAAIGSGPLSYQWYFNDLALPSGTNATLTFSTVQSSNAGPYYVFVSDSMGGKTSQVATITVIQPPVFVSHPEPQTVLAGSSVSFTGVLAGSFPMTLSLRRTSGVVASQVLSNSDTIVFTLTNVQASAADQYRMVAVNQARPLGVTSSNATLIVLSPPQITAEPTNQTVNAGANVTLRVTAAGSAPLSYQWYFNKTASPGGTNPTLQLSNIQQIQEGDYHVIITNAYGSATSRTAQVTVLITPFLSDPIRFLDGSFSLRLHGNRNTTYELQYSERLSNWTSLNTVRFTNGPIQYLDTSSPTNTQRFYRLRSAQ